MTVSPSMLALSREMQAAHEAKQAAREAVQTAPVQAVPLDDAPSAEPPQDAAPVGPQPCPVKNCTEGGFHPPGTDLRTAHRNPQRRRMPSMDRIVEYWHIPMWTCWRCGDYWESKPQGQDAPTQRAHVIDRYLGGSDDVANILPLCVPCHRAQPIFCLGEEVRAWAWMRQDWDTYNRTPPLS
jgi:hypothetical protein